MSVGSAKAQSQAQITENSSCPDKLNYCVEVTKKILAEADQYIAAMNYELQISQGLNRELKQSVEQSKKRLEEQKKNSKTLSIIYSVLGGAAAGALLSTQQYEFTMLTAALVGGLVSGGTTALLSSVIEF